ncbi:MAG: hypothetical protein MUO81_02190 [Thermoplasmata archaeon]|nr:hypothetical protein [Thermoplasmata archaeon]
MLKRLTEYLGAKPRRGAMIVLTLIIVLVLAVAGLAFQWMLLDDQADESEDELDDTDPYPSDVVPLTLVNNSTVQYVQEFTYIGYGDYSKMRFALGVNLYVAAHSTPAGAWTAVNNFGNTSQLSVQAGATMTQSIWTGSQGNGSIEIMDLTGDGRFDIGDTVLVMIDPMHEDTVYTIAFSSTDDNGSGHLFWERSFAIHDGEFYAWASFYLPTDTPWYL